MPAFAMSWNPRDWHRCRPSDGQVLVIDDMLGKNKSFSPKFLRRYADLHTIMTDAIGRFVTDVKSADFPSEHEQY